MSKAKFITASWSNLLLWLTLFFLFHHLTLPVPQSEAIKASYPFWARHIFFYGLSPGELIFALWFFAFGSLRVLNFFLRKSQACRQALVTILILALWCGLISQISPQPVRDLLRSLRLILNVCIFIAILRWTYKTPLTPLYAVIVGVFAGTITNLVMTFEYPFIVEGGLRLAGQNTPGVVMALAIHLIAWLYLKESRKAPLLFVLIFLLILLYSVGISYSRTAWFVAVTGIISWLIVFIKKYKLLGVFKKSSLAFAVFVASMVLIPSSLGHQLSDAVSNVATLIENKFNSYGDGDAIRFKYLKTSILIAYENPFGVGYSGFLEAQSTIPDAPGEKQGNYDANPHSGVLYYLVTGGFPALLLFCFSFYKLLWYLYLGMIRSSGNTGRWLALGAILSYLVISATVTYVFTFVVLFVPVAIVAGWGGRAVSRYA
jgi:O-antigen ligase